MGKPSCFVNVKDIKMTYKGHNAKIKQMAEKMQGLLAHTLTNHHENEYDIYTNPLAGVETINEGLSKITDGKFTDYRQLDNAAEETRNYVELTHDRMIKDNIIARNDHGEVLEQTVGSEGFANFVKYTKQLKGFENATRTMYNINKLVGVNYEAIHNNRYLVMKRHPIAKEIYAKYQMFKNLVSHSKPLIKKYQQIIKSAYKNTGLNKTHISEMLSFFDNMHETKMAGLKKYVEENKDSRDFRKYEKNIRNSYPEANDDELDKILYESVRRDMESVFNDWKELNYGDAREGEESVNSITGFTKLANDRLLELITLKRNTIKNYHPGLSEDQIDEMMNPIELRYMNKLKGWEPRKGYVPARRIEDDDQDIFSHMLKITDSDQEDNELSFAPIVSILNRRSKTIEGSSNSLDILTDNLQSLDFTFSRLAQYTMASTIRHAMKAETNGDWAKNNTQEYNTLKYFSENLLKYMSRSKQLSAPLEGIRNIALALAGSPAMIMAFPNSVMANYAGGYMSLLSKFGAKTFHRMYLDYKTASMPFEKAIKEVVSREVEREHLQPGRLQDYLIFSDHIGDSDRKSGLIKSTKWFRDTAFKLYDKATAKGVLSFIPAAQKFTTMHGSEQYLRKQADIVLYAKIRNELFSSKNEFDFSDPDQKQKFSNMVKEAYEKYRTDTYYEMAEGLGEFNQENKPFWTWAKLKYANNFSDIVVGTAGALWGAFRQVATHNIDRFGKSGIASFMKIKDGKNVTAQLAKGIDSKGAMRMDIVIPFAAALALAIYDNYLFQEGKKGWRFATAQNVNPFQETNAVLQAGYVGLAKGLLNLPCTEEQADEGVKKILQLAGGVGGGGVLREMYQGVGEDDIGKTFETMNPFKFIAGTYFNITDVLPEMAKGISVDEYYDLKAEVMEPLQNPYPFTSYLNDYLRVAHQLAPVIFARGENETEQDLISSKNLDQVTNILSSMFGFRGYSNVGDAWKSHYKDIRIANKLQYIIDKEDYGPEPLSKQILEQIHKYGNIDLKYLVD